MIYFLRDGASGLVKVGFTASEKSLAPRIHDYSTHCPGPVELIKTADGDRSVERDLHAMLHAHQYRGEWFRVTLDQIDSALATPGLGTLYVGTHEAGRIIGCNGSTVWLRAAEGRIPGALDLGEKCRWIVPRAWAESADARSLVQERFPRELTATIVAEYERGDTLAMIGERHGWHGNTIRLALAKAGVTIRGAVATSGKRGSRKRGAAHPNSRINEDAVRDIRRRRAAGERSTLIARDHGISLALVNKIHKRKVWKHVA